MALPLVVQTFAHELGHWLGLSHTSERDGTAHDPIADTPECGAAHDKNLDGELDQVECEGHGGGNLMFWGGHGLELTSAQIEVLRRTPLARPR